MNKILIATMLLGSVTAHGAQAAVRIFDFTATVAEVKNVGDQDAPVVPGPVRGTFVTVGDLIKGQFSFDDLGHDWTGATSEVNQSPAISFSWTLLKSDTTVNVDPPLWWHRPDYYGKSRFTVAGSGYRPGNSLSIEAPVHAFSWKLGNGTSADLTATWAYDSPVYMGANLTSVIEVSPVPEPSTWAMLALGAAMAAGAVHRARRAA